MSQHPSPQERETKELLAKRREQREHQAAERQQKQQQLAAIPKREYTSAEMLQIGAFMSVAGGLAQVRTKAGCSISYRLQTHRCQPTGTRPTPSESIRI